MTDQITLSVPARFNFRTAVYGHGWYDLAPFALDRENWRLSYVFSAGRPVTAVIGEAGGSLTIEIADDRLSDQSRAKIVGDARHMLRLDEDFEDFYRLVAAEPRLGWVGRLSGGRLLRSPTVFEDLVKTICTTNCSWALTKKMVANLVERLGAEAADGGRAFPTPEAMAGVGVAFYREEIRAGYRAPYFVELAERVASGELDPQRWLDSELPTRELKKEMKKIKGVGDYAAENLLKLVGRYDGLALDSWLRGGYYRKHNAGEICADRQIEAFYARFGPWRGLAIWCDMTEKWHE